MGSLQRRMRKNIVSQRRDRVQNAEEKVFRHLEERWSHKLNGNEIPPKSRSVMRRDPAFRAMVAQVLRGEGLAAPDLDVTPEERRDADGTPRSLFIEEMGGDPRRYLCRDCGDEPVDEERGRCFDCETLYPEE